MLIIRKKLVNSFFFYGTIDLGDRMKKKSLIIILILALCLVGCGKKDDNTKKKKPENNILGKDFSAAVSPYYETPAIDKAFNRKQLCVAP